MIFADAILNDVAYTSVTPAAIEIIRRRLGQRYLRFFGAAFTTSGEFRYKEAEPWTEMDFWFNTQNADPNVLYLAAYDGGTLYKGPVSRNLAPMEPVPTDTAYPTPTPTTSPPFVPPTPPTLPVTPRPVPRPPSSVQPKPTGRPAWVTPVLVGGGALAGLLAIGLVWRAVR